MSDKEKDAAKMPASAMSSTKTPPVALRRKTRNLTEDSVTSDQLSFSHMPTSSASSHQQGQRKESWEESSATAEVSSQILSTCSRGERQRNDHLSTGPSVQFPPVAMPRRKKGEKKTPSVPVPEPPKDKWKITPTTKVEDLKGYSFPAEDDSFDPSRFKHPFTNSFNFMTKPLPIVPGPPRRSISELRELQRQEEERLEALAAEIRMEILAMSKRYVAEMMKQVRDKK